MQSVRRLMTIRTACQISHRQSQTVSVWAFWGNPLKLNCSESENRGTIQLDINDLYVRMTIKRKNLYFLFEDVYQPSDSCRHAPLYIARSVTLYRALPHRARGLRTHLRNPAQCNHPGPSNRYRESSTRAIARPPARSGTRDMAYRIFVICRVEDLTLPAHLPRDQPPERSCQPFSHTGK